MADTIEKPKESVFVDIEVKDLPLDLRKRHKARRRKLDKLSKQMSKIHEQGDKDINSLIKRAR